MAQKGQTARFLYRGSFPDGEVFDDCEGTPHEIILGRRQVMKALEDVLLEMEPGEERTVELAAADAYGEYDERRRAALPHLQGAQRRKPTRWRIHRMDFAT